MKKIVQTLMTIVRLVAYTSAADVIVSEVMYNPAASGVDSAYEWFELHNTTNDTLDISGWRVEEEQPSANPYHYIFSTGTMITPGQTLLVVNDTASFNSEFPGVVPDIDMEGVGCYSSTVCLRLNNSSSSAHVDYLKLLDDSGVEHDQVRRGDYADADAGETICRNTNIDTDTAADRDACMAPTPGVTPFNTPPTAMTLSGNVIDENVITGSMIGNIISTDANTGDVHTYTFVAGTGDTHNDFFTLSGAAVLIDVSPDYESLSGYTLRVQSDDGYGGLYEQMLSVAIHDINEAPIAVDDIFTGSENTALVASVLPEVPVANDYDPDNGDSIVSGQIVIAPEYGIATITGSGFDYVPDVDFCGTDTLTYQVQDIGGLRSDSATVTMVIECDEEPVTRPETSQTVTGGSGVPRHIHEKKPGHQEDTSTDDNTGEKPTHNQGSLHTGQETNRHTDQTHEPKEIHEDDAPATDACVGGTAREKTYCYAQQYDINTINNNTDLEQDVILTRKDLAKMMVHFALHERGQESTQKEACLFEDIKLYNEETQEYITTACSMGLMGIESDGQTPLVSFYPERVVTRAEVMTVISRTLYGNRYDQGHLGAHDWYVGHIQHLGELGYTANMSPDYLHHTHKRNDLWQMLYTISQAK